MTKGVEAELYQSTLTSIAQSIYGAIQYTEKKQSNKNDLPL